MVDNYVDTPEGFWDDTEEVYSDSGLVDVPVGFWDDTEEEDPSLIETAGRGLAHGALGLVESTGIAAQYVGERFGSDTLAEFGERVSTEYEEKAAAYAPPESISGMNVWDNPELLKSAEWWTYNVADMVPALAATIIPGGGTSAILLKAAPKLARIGGALVGGAVGGALEGTQTYKAVLNKGGTEEEAARSAELMAVSAGTLNALGVDKVLGKAGNTFMSKVKKHLGAAVWEGISEGLEEPAEVFSKYFGSYLADQPLPDDLKEQLIESAKEAITVAPIAAVTGGAASVAVGGRSDKTKTKDDKPVTSEDQAVADIEIFKELIEKGDMTEAEIPSVVDQIRKDDPQRADILAKEFGVTAPTPEPKMAESPTEAAEEGVFPDADIEKQKSIDEEILRPKGIDELKEKARRKISEFQDFQRQTPEERNRLLKVEEREKTTERVAADLEARKGPAAQAAFQEDVVRRAKEEREAVLQTPVAQEIRKSLGDKATDNLINSGKIKLVQTEADLANITGKMSEDMKGVKGMYDEATKTSYLVMDNIPKGQAWGVLKHELGVHAGLNGLLGKRYDGLISEVDRLISEGDSALKAAMAQVPSDTDAKIRTEEALAYYIENTANQNQSLYKKIVSSIRAWAYRMGIKKRLNNQDIIAIVNSSVGRQVKEAVDEIKQGAAFGDLIKKGQEKGVTILEGEKETVIDPITKTVEIADGIVLTPRATKDIMKQIDSLNKEWRNSKIKATLDDGSVETVRAGEAADIINSNIDRARKFVECMG